MEHNDTEADEVGHWPDEWSLYAVMERTHHNERVRGIFTEAAIDQALEWGDSEFEEFHAADPGQDECVYLTKLHGVEVDLR